VLIVLAAFYIGKYNTADCLVREAAGYMYYDWI
jgi:hypothetical protein